MVRWVFILLTAVPGFAMELAAIEREVKLKDSAQVYSQAVCLNDLVEDGLVQGRCAIDRAACCRWSLSGGITKSFSRDDVQREVSKINLGGVALVLRGSDQIVVSQTHRALRADEIQEKIRGAVAAKLGDDGQNISVASLRLQTPVYVALSAESDWDVVLPETLSEQSTVKIVAIKDAGQSLGEVLGWAQASLRQNAEVYVARRTIRPMEALRLEDFSLWKENVLALSPSMPTAFRKGQFPEGTRSRQTILSGSLLSSNVVERVPLVQLGDTVTLILRSDNLKISTKGVVQGTAALGDMVTVQLSRYNRTFRGRLLEGRLVEVWL